MICLSGMKPSDDSGESGVEDNDPINGRDSEKERAEKGEVDKTPLTNASTTATETGTDSPGAGRSLAAGKPAGVRQLLNISAKNWRWLTCTRRRRLCRSRGTASWRQEPPRRPWLLSWPLPLPLSSFEPARAVR